ncbi:hypothetical protein JCM8097_007654 [Rhodosporidiobolus ruineniae]
MIADDVLAMPWVPTPTDGIDSAETLRVQLEAEQRISSLLTEYMGSQSQPLLQKDQHLGFLTKLLRNPFPRMFTSLDASRPWLLYWTIHALALFEADLDPASKTRVVETLKAMQNPEGGFGGGPGQLSHLAPSYAAVCALAYVGEEGWKAIDRAGMYRFLMSVKQPDGSFIMHEGGEVDVRGCYCALTIATLLNILTPDLAAGTSSFIASCQTYEGGLAAAAHPYAFDGASSANPSPLGEAHGGYTFCAAASWSMLRVFSDPESPCFAEAPLDLARSELDVRALLRWSASMQAMPIEGGGFRGRTNKLVDGCYSWWCGGLFPIIDGLLAEESPVEDELYDRNGLQQYITLVAQHPGGGLRDKPACHPDAYHTCYNLSGDSSAQSRMQFSASKQASLAEQFVSPFNRPRFEDDADDADARVEMIKGANESDEAAEVRMRQVWSRSLAWEQKGEKLLYGGEENELMPNHPIFNLTSTTARRMLDYFYLQPSV